MNILSHCEGRTINEIAKICGLRYESVRGHLLKYSKKGLVVGRFYPGQIKVKTWHITEKGRNTNVPYIKKNNRPYNKYGEIILRYVDGKSNINQICRETGISNTAVGAHLRKHVYDGYIKRTYKTANGRDVIYKLTKAGKEKIAV